MPRSYLPQVPQRRLGQNMVYWCRFSLARVMRRCCASEVVNVFGVSYLASVIINYSDDVILWKWLEGNLFDNKISVRANRSITSHVYKKQEGIRIIGATKEVKDYLKKYNLRKM
jgi:hypothetical protein